MTDATLEVHRGGGEVGGVALELSVDDASLLLDCGSGGSRGEAWVDELADDLEAWVSHAHLDHVGALPAATRGRPRLGGFCSSATRRLARYTMSSLAGCSPERARAVAEALDPVDSRSWFDVLDGRGRGMAFRAGHLAGARTLLVDLPSGGRLFYTGDFCGHDQNVAAGAALPSSGEKGVDTLVMEGILATDRQADETEWQQAFDELVARVEHREGPVLVAAGAVGEVCEVAAGLTARGITVAAPDGLSEVFAVYEDAVRVRRDAECELADVELVDEDRLVGRVASGGTVVAPTGGLREKSAAHRVADAICGRSEGGIGLVNGPPGRTPGEALLEAEPGDRIGALPSRPAKRADVWPCTLPTHAPRWQLVETAAMLDPDRTVLVHGRDSQLYALGRAVEERVETDVVVPETGATLELG